MRDLVIVSLHETGFPQADFYAGCGDMSAAEFSELGAVPDDFFTMTKDDTLAMARDRAIVRWPGAKIEIVRRR